MYAKFGDTRAVTGADDVVDSIPHDTSSPQLLDGQPPLTGSVGEH